MRRVLVACLAAVALVATAGPAFAAIPAKPRWTSSSKTGQWNNGGLILYNNMWNQSAGPQVIWAYNYHHWGIESTQTAGNTAVETYPCVGKPYSDVPVRSFSLIRNGFAESMPASTKGLHAEAANDVWLNKYNLEIMIWTDNIGQAFGGDQVIGHASIFGQQFTIYRNGSEFIFSLSKNETSGVTHILASIDWLMKNGFVPRNATLSQIDFGWEVSSTNGKAEDFTMTKYWLHATH